MQGCHIPDIIPGPHPGCAFHPGDRTYEQSTGTTTQRNDIHLVSVNHISEQHSPHIQDGTSMGIPFRFAHHSPRLPAVERHHLGCIRTDSHLGLMAGFDMDAACNPLGSICIFSLLLGGSNLLK